MAPGRRAGDHMKPGPAATAVFLKLAGRHSSPRWQPREGLWREGDLPEDSLSLQASEAVPRRSFAECSVMHSALRGDVGLHVCGACAGGATLARSISCGSWRCWRAGHGLSPAVRGNLPLRLCKRFCCSCGVALPRTRVLFCRWLGCRARASVLDANCLRYSMMLEGQALESLA